MLVIREETARELLRCAAERLEDVELDYQIAESRYNAAPQNSSRALERDIQTGLRYRAQGYLDGVTEFIKRMGWQDIEEKS